VAGVDVSGSVMCVDCVNLAVDQNRRGLDEGGFTADSAYRDSEMTKDLTRRINDPNNLCEVCLGGDRSES